jgi:phosphoribosylformylglycinamidine synthase I
MINVLESLTSKPVERLWHKDHDLRGVDMVVLPGGFSYGDYLRSGAIARFSPIMQEVAAHAAKGGLVFGVCNGFQVLCEAGLVPGALLHNAGQKFISKNVFIRRGTANTALTNAVPDKALKIPIAHGEGRYHADAATLKALKDNDQVLFRYCDAERRQPQWQPGQYRRGVQQGSERLRHDAAPGAGLRSAFGQHGRPFALRLLVEGGARLRKSCPEPRGDGAQPGKVRDLHYRAPAHTAPSSELMTCGRLDRQRGRYP